MKSAVLSLGICLFASAWALPSGQSEPQFKRLYADPSDLPDDIISRITNGYEATPHSIPYQAYLIVTGTSGRWLCGGSLISPSHVLTAGHCVDDGISAIVYLGAHDLTAVESSRVTVQSHTLIRHKDYDQDSISDDIGVIVLDEPVTLNEYIDVAALPSKSSSNDYEGANVRVSGWGRVSGEGSTSSVLLEVNSTVISNARCKKVFSIFLDSEVCISGNDGVGTCRGDSGGPLISNNVQIGVVSYGAKGCPAGYPSVFTRIYSYLDWLEEKTGLKFDT